MSCAGEKRFENKYVISDKKIRREVIARNILAMAAHSGIAPVMIRARSSRRARRK